MRREYMGCNWGLPIKKILVLDSAGLITNVFESMRMFVFTVILINSNVWSTNWMGMLWKGYIEGYAREIPDLSNSSSQQGAYFWWSCLWCLAASVSAKLHEVHKQLWKCTGWNFLRSRTPLVLKRVNVVVLDHWNVNHGIVHSSRTIPAIRASCTINAGEELGIDDGKDYMFLLTEIKTSDCIWNVPTC